MFAIDYWRHHIIFGKSDLVLYNLGGVPDIRRIKQSMIYKKLKTVEFIFDEENKELQIKYGNVYVSLDKIRMISLERFIIRIMQKLSVHKRNIKTK